MPSQWDHKSDKDLLLSIIEAEALKSIYWQKIAGKMQEKGYTFTHEACRQHYHKIRRESRSGYSTTSSPKKASSNGVAKTAPRKNAKSVNESFNSSFNASSLNINDDTDDDENLVDRPKKRIRISKMEEAVEGQENGFFAQKAFKIEAVNEFGAVDLENEELYEA